MELLIERLLQLSVEMTDGLRTKGLEAMDKYMEERNQLFSLLQQQQPTPEQAGSLGPRVKQIIELDQTIIDRMRQLRMEAEAGNKKAKSVRKARMLYESRSYGETSYFFDDRK